LENVINQKFFVIVKVDVVLRIHSEILKRFLLVSNKFTNKIFWNLEFENFKLMQSILYFELIVDLKNAICTKLENLADSIILVFCAYYFHGDVRAPRFLPEYLKEIKAFNILNMVLYNHIEDSFIYIKSLRFSLWNVLLRRICLLKLLLMFAHKFQVFVQEFGPFLLNFLSEGSISTLDLLLFKRRS
jgi:hypothetical protein